MAQFSNWQNTKLIVDAQHNDLRHLSEGQLWQGETNAGTFARRKWILSIFLIGFILFTLVGSAHAQSHFDATPHLEHLKAALAAGHYLDAYAEFFQINDSAPAVVKAIYETQPDSDADRQVQAFFLALTGRAEDALAAVDALPDSAFSYIVRAVADDLIGNAEDAAAALALALELAQDDAQVYGLVANAAFVDFNVESMMTNSSLALELDPHLALAYRIHGIANLFSGDPQAALADADQGSELDPTFYGFYTLRANIHLAQGEPSAALTELDAALALNPDSYVANAMRAGANAALGNTETAAQDYSVAVNVKTVEVVEGGVLEADKPVPLMMTLGKTFHLHFDAQANQMVTISVTSVNANKVDPVVLLLSPKGVSLAFNDDASDESLDAMVERYLLNKGGTYTVVVSHANGGSEGDIRVLLSLQ